MSEYRDNDTKLINAIVDLVYEHYEKQNHVKVLQSIKLKPKFKDKKLIIDEFEIRWKFNELKK